MQAEFDQNPSFGLDLTAKTLFFIFSAITIIAVSTRCADRRRKKIKTFFQTRLRVRVYAGAHASGRAGQHFDNLMCSCPIWHALNFKVMPRV